MKKLITICVVVTMILVVSGIAQASLFSLGTAESFAVLGGQAVTNTGSSVIVNGDLGVWPGSAIDGFPPGIVNGTIHWTDDGVTQQAQSDVTAAYISLAAMTPTQDLTGTDLGGLILTPGVYHFSSEAQLTGQLTLNVQNNPNALFVFQIGSELITASHSSVIMINAPEDFCKKYWQVGSSATLGSDTAFIGNILALTSITLNGGTLDGRALARNGAVTITAQETITPLCIIPEPATMCLLGLGALSLLRRKRRA
jgi:hypothetical protein